MMHSSHANRNFNLPSLDSANIEIQGAASDDDPEPQKNSVIQNNIKNLKFSIEAILSKNDNIKLTHKKLNQKVMPRNIMSSIQRVTNGKGARHVALEL